VPPTAATAPAARSTPDVAAAVDKAYSRLRERLTVGEIVAGLGAAIILVIAWATFGFLFGHGGTWPSQLVLLLSVALLAILVVQNVKVHDFGPNYRVLVTGICLALGFLAAVDILGMVRNLVDGARLEIGGLTWWAGAFVAVLGGWMVWREPR
jgi:low affinity Fe/Cu permease